ncbi:hypothetical protein [Marichromatium sp. PS1]|uniref:hypothetical protein n=1 Tax=Marichromatium sp. PS1 TaxID=3138932 RepID=UPI0034E848B8
MTKQRRFHPARPTRLLSLMLALVRSRPRSRLQQRRWLLRRHLNEHRPLPPFVPTESSPH